MKKIKSLAVLLAILCMASACTPNEDSSSSNDDKVGFEGTHEVVVEDLDGYVVKDGKSDYSIVIPENASILEQFAAKEVQSLVLEATELELPIVKDTAVTVEDKILSIGETKSFNESGVILDKVTLGTDGYRVVTIDDDVFMCGGGDYGSMYASYDFLWYTLGFKQYSVDCYTLDKTTTVSLKNFNITEIPDIAFRNASFGTYDSNSTIANRMRIHSANMLAPDGVSYHNSFKWLPPATHKEAHPKWFDDSGAQLCYTAHGDEAELTLMLEECLESFKRYYAEKPDMEVITFTQQDVSNWCVCSACKASKEKYDTDSGVLIPFMNRLSDMMQSYVESLHTDDPTFEYDIDLMFFAYNSTTNAPAKKDENGNYVPIDDNVIMNEHVSVYYAPIFMDYTQSIYSKENESHYENSLAWNSLARKIYLWLYCTNFKYFAVPYDTYNTMQEMYQFFASLNVVSIFNQGQHARNQIGLTAWHNLKAFYTAEFAWNANKDITTLTDNFFDAMYGPATETMKKFYYSYRTYSAMNMEDGKYVGSFSVYHAALKSEYWSYPVLKDWMEYINQALADIESLKNADPDKYALYYKNIVAERISICYMMIELYDSRYPENYKEQLMKTLEEDCALVQIAYVAEGGYFSDYIMNKK